jgi:hypothetical protein
MTCRVSRCRCTTRVVVAMARLRRVRHIKRETPTPLPKTTTAPSYDATHISSRVDGRTPKELLGKIPPPPHLHTHTERDRERERGGGIEGHTGRAETNVSYLQHYCYTESHRHTTGQVSSAPTNSPFCKPSLSKAFSCGGGNELFPETFRGFLQHCKLWSGPVWSF